MLQETFFRIFWAERYVRSARPTGAEDAEVRFRSARSEDTDARGVRMRMSAQPACDGLNQLAQCRVRELRIANGEGEVLRMCERAFIERISEVVVHDGCSLCDKKGYQSELRSKDERPSGCVGKGNRERGTMAAEGATKRRHCIISFAKELAGPS